MELSVNDIVLKLLGLLLLTAAVLKGYELLTEPVANSDIWSNRYFLIFTVEFELALGIWLLSGIFKKLAWLAAAACFGVFCCVTLYKALAGYGSCGCFGKVHVNPWITLFAIDLPVMIGLFFVKPKNICNIIAIGSSGIFRSIFNRNIPGFLPDLASRRLIFVSSFTILSVITSSVVLAINKPANVTSNYEVLYPETWIGKELPIMEHIDIAEQISTGNWLLLFYHHDCPNCQEAIVQYEQMAVDLEGNEDFLQVAIIEVPPYEVQISGSFNQNNSFALGKLDMSKEWFVAMPAIALLDDSTVRKCWEKKMPEFDLILSFIAKINR